jgi:hypothetical protein
MNETNKWRRGEEDGETNIGHCTSARSKQRQMEAAFNICSTPSESEAMNEFEAEFQYSEPFYITISSSFGILKGCQNISLQGYLLTIHEHRPISFDGTLSTELKHRR